MVINNISAKLSIFVQYHRSFSTLVENNIKKREFPDLITSNKIRFKEGVFGLMIATKV